jgi:stringent starvation protein B
MMNALESTSTRPYLIRALYEWCTDNGLTPYIAVLADDSVQVPREYVQNGEIVLNVSFDATSALKLGNEFIEFKARFAGVPREIIVPIDRVIAIYARESGQGMAFPVAVPTAADDDAAEAEGEHMPESEPDGPRSPVQLVSQADEGGDDDGPPANPPPPRKRPALKVVK